MADSFTSLFGKGQMYTTDDKYFLKGNSSIYLNNNKEEKRLNKLFIHYAQIFGPAAFLGGAKKLTHI